MYKCYCSNIFFILLWQKCFSISGVATTELLRFLRMMFVMIGDLTESELITRVGKTFPLSLPTVKGILGIDINAFKINAVCSKCSAIYKKQVCTKTLPDRRKVVVFQSLFSSLKTIFNSEDFKGKCERWRKQYEQTDSKNEMREIYDGKVSNEFQNFDGKPFLCQQDNCALILNVDWFNPLTHLPGSIGALYCVFANLPQDEKFKRQNIVLLV